MKKQTKRLICLILSLTLILYFVEPVFSVSAAAVSQSNDNWTLSTFTEALSVDLDVSEVIESNSASDSDQTSVNPIYTAPATETTVDAVYSQFSNYSVQLMSSNEQYTEDNYVYTLDTATGVAKIIGYSGTDTEVNIPSELGGYPVTSVGASAFYGNTSVTKIVFPQQVKKIGNYAFYCCYNLSEINFPDGLTEIGEQAFRNCSSLQSVSLPDSVTTIGNNAFSDCSALSSINFPTNWSYAGSSIFSGCTGLVELVVPEGVTSIPAHAFYNSSLKKISLPSTLTSINNYAFYCCYNLSEINFPDGLTEIGEQAFHECNSLRQITIPTNIESVGSYAFSSCDNLTSVLYEGTNLVISNTAFNSCANLVLYCLPPLVFWAIKNNIFYVVLGKDSADYSEYALDLESTVFYSTTDIPQLNHYTLLALDYTLKEGQLEQLENPVLKITMTQSAEVSLHAITLDGKLLTNYSFDATDNSLTIPIETASGELRLAIVPTEGGVLGALASLDYEINKKSCTDWIGCISLRVPTLNISAPAQTSSATITVSGYTDRGREIQLYLGETLLDTVVAKKDGTFSTKVSFPEQPVDGTSYTLSAFWADDPSVETQCEILYKEDVLEITQFDMYYRAHSTQKINLLESMGTRICTSISPGHEMEFHIKLENAENVDEVYVISTKNGISKKMKAEPTGEDGCYIASGFFDESDTKYLPGRITLGYTEKVDAVNLASIPAEEEMAEELQGSTVTVITDTEDEYQAKIEFTNGESLVCHQTNMSIEDAWSQYHPSTEIPDGSSSDIATAFFELLSTNHSDAALSEDYRMAMFRTDNLFTYLVWDPLKNEIQSNTIDVAAGTAGVYMLNAGIFTLDQSYDVWNMISDSNALTSAVDIYVSGIGDMFSLARAELEIMYSRTLTDYQKAAAQAELRKFQNAYGGLWAFKIACACATGLATASAGPLAGFLVGYVTNMACQIVDDYLTDSLMYYAATGQSIFCKWIIDPSGYVYNLNTGALLEGVTTTAYWIPCEEPDEDYWNAIPAEDEYGEVWDASEYSQCNPLVTGSDGRYAWDVPEGWWRVKYEKAGYETAWSNWMTVLPVQTDVNIGLLPLNLPDFEFQLISVQENAISVSVTNNTSNAVSTQYALAVYDICGRMIDIAFLSADLASGSSVPLTLEFADNCNAANVVAFILDTQYLPLCDAWSFSLLS